MKLKPVFLFAVAALVTSTAVVAAPATKDSGWYVGGGLGRANNTVSNITYPKDTTVNTKSTAYRLHGGYQFNEYFMTEMSYVDFGSYKADSPTLEGRVKSRALTMSAIGMLPLTTDFSLLGKLGVAHLYTDSMIGTKDGSRTYEHKATHLTALVGAGVRYLITPNLALRAEYDYVHPVKILDSETVKSRSTMMSLSVDYRF